MKKILFASILALLSVVNVFAQSSTEGKEFWVALTLSAAPSSGLPEPFLAISTKKLTTVTVTCPANPGWAGFTRQVTPGAWATITTADIPLNIWYPTAANSIGNIPAQAGQTHPYGLKITTDQEVSAFAALRMVNSFDAANVLPTTALQSEYITQDYPPYIKPDDGASLAMFTILATEDNTVVEITPSSTTSDNHVAGTMYTVTLSKGQTYYVISRTQETLSGSHVVARNGKKIAVFQGDVFTQIPGGKAARDCTFEQAMPVDYWGTKFVVTRSLEKDANRVRVTAMEDGTEIKIDGIPQATLAAFETYEFELTNSQGCTTSGLIHAAASTIHEDAVYLESSCPVAVYSYDVSNGYKSTTTEQVDDKGDPSMVWISPLEQRINEINFGVCPTNKTEQHFIDIVCLTSATQLTTLTSQLRPNGVPMTFQPVPGNPLYSYARVKLVNTTTSPTEIVFKLSNPNGVIAHVYGNGNDESYAYSVGSSTIKQGVQIGNFTLIDGTIGEHTYCVGQPIHMDAQVGSLRVDRAIWDMGDGVTISDGRTAFDYTYETPGWYDLTTVIFAHKDCPETVYPPETIRVAYHVVEPDTLRRQFFICEGDVLNYGGQNYTQPTQDTAYFNCDSVVVFTLEVGAKSVSSFDTIAHDEFQLGSKTIYTSGIYQDTLVNAVGCDSIITANVRIVTCLNMQLSEQVYTACGDDQSIFLGYHVNRGDVGEAKFVYGNMEVALEPAGGAGWYLSLNDVKPGHYSNAMIAVLDTNCNQTVELPLSIDILYPSSIFEQKWDDVLAVLNKKYNGGYDVIGYQWYLDGMPIIDATSSVLYVGPDETLLDGGAYAVELTTRDGVTLMSCPKIISLKTNSKAPQKKAVLVAPGVISIEVDGQEYLVR